MSVVPGSLETDTQPPMRIPLAHFVVGLGFLLAGALPGVAGAIGVGAGTVALVHVHLLLVGWVCVTIMGAMTQFVPVWSGVELHDRRLATAQLWLVAVGLVGFAVALSAGWFRLTPVFGGLMAGGFWVFAYNIGRTLARVDSLDVTERHFAAALCFFLLLTVLGVALAVDLAVPLFAGLPVARGDVVGAHATLAVFGAILTTVLGALSQLGPMFTQTERHGIDLALQRVEEVGYPVGVTGLATARLFGIALLGRVGGLLVVAGLASASVLLGRRLLETRVPWTPMLSRYAVATAAMGLWSVLAVPAWLATPLDPAARFGAPGTVHLLTLGVVGFVVLGTLYHVVPFVVWVHRYSERLGREAVPMIDDLYDGRLAAADLALIGAGGLGVVAADHFLVPAPLSAIAGGVLALGTVAFAANILGVVRRHSPHTLGSILLERGERDASEDTPSA